MVPSKKELGEESSPQSLKDLVATSAKNFLKRYGRPHDWIAAAPGRVNLIGEHVDYNDGFVLPMAIERWTVIAAGANDSKVARFYSHQVDELTEIPLDMPIDRSGPDWALYLRGVLDGFAVRGIKISGLDAIVDSSIPVGGGLSSSAALEVAMATILECSSQVKLDPIDKALLCQFAEREFAGVPCGIMDQFATTFCQDGHAMLLDCRSHEFQHVAMNQSDVAILIANTNVSHTLNDGVYAQRRSECEQAAEILKVPSLREASLDALNQARSQMEANVFRRAQHVITEIERTRVFADKMRIADWESSGRLMFASHDSLRNEYEVSCAELDAFVEIARSIGVAGGVYGCRMTGGGFGGCTVSLVQAELAGQIATTYDANYRNATGITPSIFVTRASDGAEVLSSKSIH